MPCPPLFAIRRQVAAEAVRCYIEGSADGLTAGRHMSELVVNEDLVGQRVCLPTRPEWGAGTVLRVQATLVDGQPVHRVSIQFTTGHRTLVIPPARLAVPEGEPQREAGWLDTLGRQTIDDRLTALPEAVREFLGASAQRIVVLARLYEIDEDATGLIKWARSQSGVGDPLSLWTRDEIRAAFEQFCRRRDQMLRDAVTALRRTSGQSAVAEAFTEVSDIARDRMLAVVR